MNEQSLQVSVVVGVRDGGEHIVETLRSVCTQRGVVLECIVVDDGSTDGTADRIAALARCDQRVRLFRQRPAGLTRALITGCAEARAPLIARIDSGDRMLPGRLARQCALMSAHPWIDVLGSLFRECGPNGEALLEQPDEDVGRITDLTSQQRSAELASLIGIFHISVCFRSDAYRCCGGYRAQFALAQDVDLWARMAEFGGVARLEEVLTVSRVSASGLSPGHHQTQLRLREIATAAVAVRARGGDERPLLQEAWQVSHSALNRGGARGAAAYYVACRLARAGNARAARNLFHLALRLQPLNPRHVAGFIRICLLQAPWRKM